MTDKYICGNLVQYDENDPIISYGLSYLEYDLDQDEAAVFFSYAKKKGQAKFEDDYEYQYTLKYDFASGKYILEKRDY